ncbi:chymotrypsin-like elastase family member 3B [Elysia marginata]|uniref:Chymotrypsin-like elastase family member 3B n=1 Tax=Elysia marginata TaxID=1093978 RepID=A0AAV4GEJ2_9GAST|nr:chymotrypsin-like elastase family member 3B [Elysia marginata]
MGDACCVWGGECRRSCNADERQLQFPSDCEPARRGVCCMNSSQTRVALPPTGPQPLPLPPLQTNIAMRQGRCQSNPVLGARVLGGTQVAPEDWPWMVRLIYRGGQRAVCSGVLVDPDTVITVAHCVNGTRPRDVQIQVGDFDLSQPERDEQLISVAVIMTQTDFVMGSLGNDFAIIKLSRPARLGPRVMPACLPDPRVQLVTGPEARCFMAGWGADNRARGDALG